MVGEGKLLRDLFAWLVCLGLIRGHNATSSTQRADTAFHDDRDSFKVSWNYVGILKQ